MYNILRLQKTPEAKQGPSCQQWREKVKESPDRPSTVVLNHPMLVDQPPFYGDGRYPGDGGAALEALWQLMPWREIRNCPGRKEF